MTEARAPVAWSWGAASAYVAVHVGCLGVLVTGFNARNLLILLGFFTVRMWALTVGYHRYFAHRSYAMERVPQALLALLGSTCLQGGVLWWAETHRRHHRGADTPEDLHSPHFQGWFYSHFGWFLDQQHRETRLDAVRDLSRFPELVWLDRWHIVPFLAATLLTGWTLGWAGVVWGMLIPTVMMWEITHWVQSFSHCFAGYRRFETRDQSRNHWLLGVIALGEYHNNHHRFPGSARQGSAWWELDLGYGSLRVLHRLGIVTRLNVPKELTPP
ncbi:MAG: fatty acid desaturase [Alphaproteobacteria bacterium]|nr:fatty acid desaturase [Alphaproteobacteria bacterium]